MTVDNVARADTLLNWRRPQEAEELLRAVLATDPADARALRSLARALGLLGRRDEQAATARKAIAADPANVSGYTILSDSLHEQGDYQGAVEAGQLAVQVESNSALAHYVLGRAYLGGKRSPAQALIEANWAITLDPQSSSAHNLRGAAQAALGQRDAAEESYRTAVRLNPNSATALSNIVGTEIGRGRLGPASRSLRAGLASSPGHSALHRNYDLLLIRIILWLQLVPLGLAYFFLLMPNTSYVVHLEATAIMLVLYGGCAYFLTMNLPSGAHIWARGILKRVNLSARLLVVWFGVLSSVVFAVGVIP